MSQLVWSDIVDLLNRIKEDHRNQAKRAIKTKVPKQSSVRTEIVENVVKFHNEYVNVTNTYWQKLTPEHKAWIRNSFDKLRDTTVRVFTKLNVRYAVPYSPGESLDTSIQTSDTEDSEPEEQEISETQPDQNKSNNESNKMPQSASDFFSLADKFLPKTFDGNPQILTSFLDALQLLKQNCKDHEDNALSFVKTRLIGKARLAITDDIITLDGVIAALKSKCLTLKPHLIEAKLASVRQNGRDAATFAKQIEELAESLYSAYISEGIPVKAAEDFVKTKTVRCLTTNAHSDKSRLIIEAGSFSNFQEAISKFLTIDMDQTSSDVMFVKNNTRSNFYRGSYRGRGNFGTRGNYQWHGNYGNHNNSNQGHNNQYFGKNFQQAYNNNRGGNYNNFRGRGRDNNYQQHNIRFTELENSENPHQEGMGDTNQQYQ